jgi:steroid delta-isomerase-like uncharacterized protein
VRLPRARRLWGGPFRICRAGSWIVGRVAPVAETGTRTNDQAATNDRAAATKEAEQPKAPRRRRITKRKAVEAVAKSYFDALGARDVDGLLSHWHEDGVDDIVPLGVRRGHREIEQMFREMFAAAPDLAITPSRILAGEKQAAVEWRLRGTFTGSPFQGIEPTGRPFELRGLDMLEIEDGKIRSITGYYDGAEYARQIGMLPPQDSGAERAMTSAFNALTKVRRAVNERRGT